MPRLMAFHAAVVRAQAAPVQIVLVPYDAGEAEAVRFLRAPIGKESKSPMPWASVPFTSELRRALIERYATMLRGLPTLVLITEHGVVVSNRGYDDILRRGAEAYSEVWAPLLASPAPLSISIPGMDLFASADDVVSELRAQAAANPVAGPPPTRRLVLLHLGAEWCDGSVALEAALRRPEVEEAVRRGFVLGRLCYETCQRWLKEKVARLHHGPNPSLIVLSDSDESEGGLVAEYEPEEAAGQAEGGSLADEYPTERVLAFLASASAGAVARA